MDGRAAPEARYEARESVELAFVAALQHLPARQRAVLILREVLGYSANEVADTLETSTPAVNSALQRARKTIDETLPERSQQETLRTLGDDRVREMVEGYMDAWERGDVEAVTAMLAEDATITMPPMATWFQGEGVEIFLTEWAFSGRAYDAEGRRNVRVLPAHANGQPAIGTYSWDDERGAHLPTVLQVLTFDGDRITEITGFVDPSVFGRFGLPRAAVSEHEDTAWFERLYAAAEAGDAEVPWDRGGPNPFLEQWVRERGLEGAGRRALVIGTALGDDAELLAARGYAVTAFDVSPTAIEGARRRFPDSSVDYRVADLLDLPAECAARSTSSRSASPCRRCRCPCGRGRSTRSPRRSRRAGRWSSCRGSGTATARATGRRGRSRARSSTASRRRCGRSSVGVARIGPRRAGGASTPVRSRGRCAGGRQREAGCRQTSLRGTTHGPESTLCRPTRHNIICAREPRRSPVLPGHRWSGRSPSGTRGAAPAGTAGAGPAPTPR